MVKSTMLAAVAALTMAAPLMPAHAADPAAIARGKYLVAIAGCNDCHTPGYFLGKPDMARFLGGSEVGFDMPGLGVFHGPNLTPDKETGLGGWTPRNFVETIRNGRHQGRGRPLLPPMPWEVYSNLTDDDLESVFAYLQSIPPVKNRVPQPLPPVLVTAAK